MMLDANVVAVSPATVYRVLSQAGRLGRRWAKPSKKGTGFVQPLRPHEHWHIDISYLNIAGTFSSEVILGQENIGKAMALAMVAVVAVVMTLYTLLERRTSKWLGR